MAQNYGVPEWIEPHRMDPKSYTCAYCGSYVGSDLGYAANYAGAIHICPKCKEPSYFTQVGVQIPGVPYGDNVAALPQDVAQLYAEARRDVGANAFTSSVMVARKILMHVAVEKDAKPNLSFAEYVGYLDERGYIPPDGKAWVDKIRSKGNEANHEIVIMSGADAKELLDFLGMLLKFVYEFPSRIPRTK
jgi:hypothetical protein